MKREKREEKREKREREREERMDRAVGRTTRVEGEASLAGLGSRSSCCSWMLSSSLSSVLVSILCSLLSFSILFAIPSLFYTVIMVEMSVVLGLP